MPPNTPQQSTPQKITAAQRRQAAVTLRLQGGTYEAIATQIRSLPGVSPKYGRAQACRDVMDELRKVVKETAETAAEIKKLELERIDIMWAALWPYAQQGDYAALDRCLRLQDQRAKYMGLFEQPDTPRGAEMLTNADGTPIAPRIREIVIQLHGVDAQAHQQVLPPDESEGNP